MTEQNGYCLTAENLEVREKISFRVILALYSNLLLLLLLRFSLNDLSEIWEHFMKNDSLIACCFPS